MLVAGTVVDDRQVPIAGARIAVVGTAQSATTDTRGLFRLENLPGDSVSLRITAIGYRPHILSARVGNEAMVIPLIPAAFQLQRGDRHRHGRGRGETDPGQLGDADRRGGGAVDRPRLRPERAHQRPGVERGAAGAGRIGREPAGSSGSAASAACPSPTTPCSTSTGSGRTTPRAAASASSRPRVSTTSIRTRSSPSRSSRVRRRPRCTAPRPRPA